MQASELEKALSLALKAHQGQKDKSGQPYILHPVRVMLRFQETEARIVALLHDVLEDSDISIDELQHAGFGTKIIEAVRCLTRKPNEEYLDYIRRIKENPLARKVKLADLKDNLDVNRLEELQAKDCRRLERYLQAKKILSW